MSAAPPSGPPPGEVTVEQLLQAQVDALCRLIPGTTPEVAYKALTAAAHQEMGLSAVWQGLAEDPRSHWALRLSRQSGPGKPMVFHAPKLLHGQLTGMDINNWALQMGILSSSFLRAALLCSGWFLEFSMSDGGPSANKIII